MCGSFQTLGEAQAAYADYPGQYSITTITDNGGKEYLEILDKDDESILLMTQGEGRVQSSNWMYSPHEVAEFKDLNNIQTVSPLTPQVTEQAV